MTRSHGDASPVDMEPASGSLVADLPSFALDRQATLVDAVDHLLNRGAVLVGEAKLSLAGVDLVYLGLNLLVSSVETLRQGEPTRNGDGSATHPLEATGDSGEPLEETRAINPDGDAVEPTATRPMATTVPSGEPAELPSGFTAELSRDESATDRQKEAGRDLARLVLTLIELLRQILERQAVRRMEGGGLSDAQIERMGLALLELEAKMARFREIFDLEGADLNVDLGPLGKLL